VSERVKIKVNNLCEMNELLNAYNWPAEMFLPNKVFELINFRSQSTARGLDMATGVPFVWFSGTKLRPSKRTKNIGIVDLSDAEVIDAPP